MNKIAGISSAAWKTVIKRNISEIFQHNATKSITQHMFVVVHVLPCFCSVFLASTASKLQYLSPMLWYKIVCRK